MILKELQYHFHEQLDAVYGKNEVSSFFKLLAEYYLNLKPIDLALDPEFRIPNSEQDHFYQAIARLKKEEPIQYIMGKTEFFGLTFKVNPSTLIPRPETEELVRWIIAEESIQNSKFQIPNTKFQISNTKFQVPNPKFQSRYLSGPNSKHQIPNSKFEIPNSNNKHLSILDIGTGSGCIAISLAKHLPNAKVYAMDVSTEALKVAKENAELNEVTVTFIEDDILNRNNWSRWLSGLVFKKLEFDIIVSNPPYVRQLEKSLIKDNVLKHEPHLALFVNTEDPFLFYKAICGFAVHNLKPKGRLFFEINQYLGAEMKQLLNTFNFESIELRKDLFGNDRMLKSIKP